MCEVATTRSLWPFDAGKECSPFRTKGALFCLWAVRKFEKVEARSSLFCSGRKSSVQLFTLHTMGLNGAAAVPAVVKPQLAFRRLFLALLCCPLAGGFCPIRCNKLIRGGLDLVVLVWDPTVFFSVLQGALFCSSGLSEAWRGSLFPVRVFVME